ncbi:hypothetical protein C8F01DRAFT_1229293 [Mycena amicta]|nr:hypothetical protein C8F01DRAFT_1229293 [Mycena amicta]
MPRKLLDFNSPSRLFRAFGGLFVLFGAGFYAARRVIKARRTAELEAWRAGAAVDPGPNLTPTSILPHPRLRGLSAMARGKQIARDLENAIRHMGRQKSVVGDRLANRRCQALCATQHKACHKSGSEIITQR